MKPPFDLAALRRAYEQRTGLLTGFTTAADLARYPHVVRLDGLCRYRLGDARFQFVLHRCRTAAVRLAALAFRCDAIHGHHRQRTGTEFRFADAMTALRFGLCHQAAMQGRPCPTL